MGLRRGDPVEYDRLRLSLGVADGSKDLVLEKAILLEAGFDELNGVDWKKGCYMGQELTARTKYRGLVKKRLMPVRVDGPLPAPGTPVMLGDQEAGELRSGSDGLALALLRLDAVEAAAGTGRKLSAGEATLEPVKPPWAQF
jgi:folate-binding protein YgfZ